MIERTDKFCGRPVPSSRVQEYTSLVQKKKKVVARVFVEQSDID
jgi:hypothetical protein